MRTCTDCIRSVSGQYILNLGQIVVGKESLQAMRKHKNEVILSLI